MWLNAEAGKRIGQGRTGTMLSRRTFGACAICSAVGLVASGAEAQPLPTGQIPSQNPNLQVTILRRLDLPGGAHEAIQILVEAAPNATVARHTHPGVESSVVLEGGGEQVIDGQLPLPVSPGSTWQAAAGVPHGGRYGPQGCKLIVTLSVEKGKPMTSPA
jgi:quercetin dioxygenase-like cupin family protein